MAIIDDEDDPLAAAQRKPNYGNQSNFPAVNQFANSNNTAFARNAPVNTLQQNLNQIPVGGFGLGALNQAGYSRTPPVNLDNFMNRSALPDGFTNFQGPKSTIHFLPPGFTAAVGSTGLPNSSPNDINFLPPGFTSVNGVTGANGELQAVPSNYSDQASTPQAQYAAPILNGARSPQSDPSVGALDNASRYTNVYGQQVVNPVGGGQMISGRGPTVGSLGNNRWVNNQTGQQTINTPSGGTIKAGPSRSGLRKPQKMTTGQTYSLGGWY